MSRGTALVAALVLLGAAVIAYQAYLLLGIYVGDCWPSTPTETRDNLQPGAAEVSALIEEAKRITGESA